MTDPAHATWRVAREQDDDTIVRLCLALNAEDPGEPVAAEQVRRTLDVLRAEPVRGRALVAEVEGEIVGYALLVSFWSNEYGGEICAIDELYLVPAHRSRGIGTGLLERLVDDRNLWPPRPVALELRDDERKRSRARALRGARISSEEHHAPSTPLDLVDARVAVSRLIAFLSARQPAQFEQE